ncbi:hypothetical protein BDY19DRAFT_994930 [Irpex rosettiformis]|uniref:Uncharacterized protein n=1 Tax=Irpex rosettiformis TaxID=378272 RepID=A0ACB8U029_9APHY|nr:hypothetical protein BDY19DRAFT_994930 [Irpex rosettiformis]
MPTVDGVEHSSALSDICISNSRQQTFDNSDDIQCLYRVLSRNSRLEGLVLENCRANPDTISILETLQSLSMPYLKHIVVKGRRDNDSGVIVQLIETKLVLQADHAKSYSYLSPNGLSDLFPTRELCIFPAKKLFIGGFFTVVVGTDDRNSFLIFTRITPFLEKYALHAQRPKVTELWLQSQTFSYQDLADIGTADVLQGVTKLVLLTDIERCLSVISEYSYFPSLVELHLLISWEGLDSTNVARILNSLRARQDAGHPIRKLHIALNSSDGYTPQIFEFWKNREKKFRDVVFDTTFEDASDNLRRMELPSVCMEGLPAQFLWKRWDNIYIERQLWHFED